jgi:hypothetical protein
MPNRPPARANVEAALRAQATRTAVDLIKERARAYAKRPMTLEKCLSPSVGRRARDNNCCGEASDRGGEKCPVPVVWFWRGGPNPQRQGGFAFRARLSPGRWTTSPKAGARFLNPICLAASQNLGGAMPETGGSCKLTATGHSEPGTAQRLRRHGRAFFSP